MEEHTLINKIKDPDGNPCPSCPSSDGYKIDKNGWGHCFRCHINVPPEKAEEGAEIIDHPTKAATKPKLPKIELVDRYVELPDRAISKETCEKYKIWREEGKDFFPSFKNRQHVGTKYRNLENKRDQLWTGEQGELHGQFLFPAGCAKYITVTEGEYDMLSAYEMHGSKWPVVSVLNGTGSALQDCRRNFEYLCSFGTVVLSFDNDEAGVKAAKEVAALPWPPGKLKVMTHRLHKDANDYKKAGDRAKYVSEWWDAPVHMPDHLRPSGMLLDELLNRPRHYTVDYPWPTLNRLTYGIRLSEAVLLMADTGSGKTSLMKEMEYFIAMNQDVREKGYKLGLLHLEEPNYDTALGLLSVHKNKCYHLPDVERTPEELKEAFKEVLADNKFILYDHFGSNQIDTIIEKIRNMVALGCRYIFLDHLSIVVSDQSGDERKQLDEISTKLKTLTMELNIAVVAVIHTNREGQVRGSAGPEQLANIHLSLHRAKKDPNEWRRNVTKVVVEKNRFCGRTGPASYLYYDPATGRMTELDPDEIEIYEKGEWPKDYQMKW